jgi:hypothetical protein
MKATENAQSGPLRGDQACAKAAWGRRAAGGRPAGAVHLIEWRSNDLSLPASAFQQGGANQLAPRTAIINLQGKMHRPEGALSSKNFYGTTPVASSVPNLKSNSKNTRCMRRNFH